MSNYDQIPLEQIHDELWKMLEARTDFCNLVSQKNRIRLFSTESQGRHTEPLERTSPTPSDLPEVRIVPTGQRAHHSADSTHSKLVVTWEIQISTGRRWVNDLLKIQWAVFCAMTDWVAKLEVLTWRGKSYVRDTRALQIVDSLDNRERNRTARGWSSVWACETTLWFDMSDLKAD